MELKRWPHITSVMLLGVALLGIFAFSTRPTMAVAEQRLTGIPIQLGAMRGSDIQFDESVFASLDVDDNVFRNYTSSDGQDVFLYVGYYGTAKGGRTIHVPKLCYTGQGWSIEEWEERSIRLANSTMVDVNRMVVRKGALRRLVYFWFQSEDIIMASGLDLNIYKFQHRLLYNRNDGAFVRVSLEYPEGREGETEEKVKKFSEEIVPFISQNWPIEKPIVS